MYTKAHKCIKPVYVHVHVRIPRIATKCVCVWGGGGGGDTQLFVHTTLLPYTHHIPFLFIREGGREGGEGKGRELF